jgi:hypothetical protein
LAGNSTYFAAIRLFRRRVLSRGTKILLYKTPIRPGENGGKQNLYSRTGGAETKGKTQERTEKRGRKGSSCARSEEMRELATDRKKWRDIVRQAKAHSGL